MPIEFRKECGAGRLEYMLQPALRLYDAAAWFGALARKAADDREITFSPAHDFANRQRERA